MHSARRLAPIVLGCITAALLLIAWHESGIELVWLALSSSAYTFVTVLPLILSAFAITGLIQVVFSDESMRRWMGTEQGWRGMLLGGAVGAVIPGGPYVYYPMIVALLRSGASIGTVVTFISAKKLWGVVRLPVEFALLGPRLTLVRFAITLVFPPLIGVVTQILFRDQAEYIRRDLMDR